MKRWLVRIFAFLLLGAIVNVAVAWAILPKFKPGSKQQVVLSTTEARAIWNSYAPDCWPMMNIQPVRDSRGACTTDVLGATALPTGSRWWMLQAYQCGWPMKSLRGASLYTMPATQGDTNSRGLLGSSDRPFYPIWPGFAINTVFYAAILWMLLAAPFALRRWRRIRRGLCPKCGYDLRGRPPHDSATCPECGAVRLAS